MIRTCHTFRGNHFCVITRDHTITLNMVNVLVIEILYIRSNTIKERLEGDVLQENKYCKEEIIE
jgi:hypothetical protein